MEQAALDTPLDEIGLSLRILNVAMVAGWRTLGDVAKLSDAEILRRPNLGRKSLNELREVFRAYGVEREKTVRASIEPRDVVFRLARVYAKHLLPLAPERQAAVLSLTQQLLRQCTDIEPAGIRSGDEAAGHQPPAPAEPIRR